MAKTKTRLKEKINYFEISPQLPNKSGVNIKVWSKKLPKDVLTTDVIDYDFMKVALNPPKKQKREYYHQWISSMSYSSAMSKKKEKKNSSNSSGNFGGGRGRNNQNQLCMFKCFYDNNKEKHKNFLKNYMPQLNKNNVIDKPVLFNDELNQITEDEILKYENSMSDKYFKFIISPESQKVPIKEFVISFMKQIETLTGYSFNYMAVQHSDTGHKHAHILINGIDKNGKEIHFKREFFKETARAIASQVCTNYIGYRTQEQINIGKEKALHAFHLVPFDKTIIENEKKYPSITTINNVEYEGEYICQNEKAKQRMEVLSKIGFAKLKKNSGIPPIYYLTKNWVNSLKTAKNYNSFLTARNNLSFTSAANLEQYKKDTGEIDGVITQRFIMDDEENWNNAVVIENKNSGKAYYVPIGFEPEEKLIGSAVKCFAPSGSMHPKIVVQNKNRTLEKNN